MKKEFLLSLGIDEETATKIRDENGKDIQNIERKLDAATKERDDFKLQLDDVTAKLKAFDGVDVDALQGEIKTLTDSLADGEKKYQSELDSMKRQADTNDFLAEHKFVAPEVKEVFANRLNEALADKANEGKNRKDIFDEMIKGEDGKPRTDIFAPVDDNPNKLNFVMPPVGGSPPATMTMTQQIAQQLGIK